ncbi:hypothetical protein E2C01_043765 [Portunus trituberculatus]|uniref:Uncharacterized protein n=1 Tax=Portunus trituberculatus TaxID=210409 RepID=A0A5B7FQB8_PORTR|nr:hypothetical protein [Portunus trituberculatus]
MKSSVTHLLQWIETDSASR